jgi:hypothetical protein
MSAATPIDATVFHANGYPDLQAWVRRFNGYPNIPWDLWDAAVDPRNRGATPLASRRARRRR